MVTRFENGKTYKLVDKEGFITQDSTNSPYIDSYFPYGIFTVGDDNCKLIADAVGDIMSPNGLCIICVESEGKFFEGVNPSHTHTFNTEPSPNELCLKVQQLSDEVGCFIQFTPENKVCITHSYSDIELNCDCTEVEEVLKSFKVLNKYI